MRKAASFVAIKGRTTYGKSCLIQEFSKHFDQQFLFSGLPLTSTPTSGVTTTSQINDWNEFFSLSKEAKTGPTLIALDEISRLLVKSQFFDPKDLTFYITHGILNCAFLIR